ncbi:MAG: hypothetical protein JWP45_2997, partial [Mucilaginibacter sp.]|nr:hypothetical protein [Mucilaginibacter sp.]
TFSFFCSLSLQTVTLHDYLSLIRTFHLPPHGSDYIYFTFNSDQLFISLYRKSLPIFLLFSIPFFWDCKGKNLFYYRKLYFLFIFKARFPVPFTLFATSFPGCKGKQTFVFCKSFKRNNRSILITLCKSALKN